MVALRINSRPSLELWLMSVDAAAIASGRLRESSQGFDFVAQGGSAEQFVFKASTTINMAKVGQPCKARCNILSTSMYYKINDLYVDDLYAPSRCCTNDVTLVMCDDAVMAMAMCEDDEEQPKSEN